VHTLFTIAPASSTTTLQADKQTIVSGESVTLTAKVVADSEAATGQVAFTNGSTTLGTATLDPDGTASLTVPLSTGTATIVAVYSGSLYVNTSTSAAVTVTVTAPVPPDFKLSASKTAISLTAGQNGTVTLTITPENGFEDAVQFSCSGLPAGASCTFSPTSVTPIGAPASVTVTVTTATQTAALRPLPMMFATMLPGVVGLFGVVSNRRKRVMIALAMVIALALLGATVACGGGGATGNNPPQKQPTTTTTPVTITAKSTSVSHTVTVDLSITQ
jgi:hypothetical protein